MRLFPCFTLAACSETGVARVSDSAAGVRSRSPQCARVCGGWADRGGGRTGSEYSTVYVEGVAVPVADDGTFSVALPIDGPYAIVDVSADLFEASAEARVPVFRGYDPLETWPGGIAARLTPSGLDGLAAVIEPTIAEALNPEALLQGLPGPRVTDFLLRDPDITARSPRPSAPARRGGHRGRRRSPSSWTPWHGRGARLPRGAVLTVTIDEVLIGLGIVAGLGPNDDIQISLGEPVLDVAEPEFEVFDPISPSSPTSSASSSTSATSSTVPLLRCSTASSRSRWAMPWPSRRPLGRPLRCGLLRSSPTKTVWAWGWAWDWTAPRPRAV